MVTYSGTKRALADPRVLQSGSWVVLSFAAAASLVDPDRAHVLVVLALAVCGLPASLVLGELCRKRTVREAALLAQRDDLTGLLNRRVFAFEAEALLEYLPVGSLALALYDVDGLKALNDECGHQAGDELIRGAARYLEENAPAGSTVYRIGGDEFAVLIDRSGGAGVASMIRSVTGFEETFAVCGHEHRVRMSCGIAFSQDDDSFDSMFQRADAILCDTKERLYAGGLADRRRSNPGWSGQARIKLL